MCNTHEKSTRRTCTAVHMRPLFSQDVKADSQQHRIAASCTLISACLPGAHTDASAVKPGSDMSG